MRRSLQCLRRGGWRARLCRPRAARTPAGRRAPCGGQRAPALEPQPHVGAQLAAPAAVLGGAPPVAVVTVHIRPASRIAAVVERGGQINSRSRSRQAADVRSRNARPRNHPASGHSGDGLADARRRPAARPAHSASRSGSSTSSPAPASREDTAATPAPSPPPVPPERPRTPVQDRREDARRVRPRHAHPLHCTARRDQGIALAVRQEPIVRDRGEGALPARPAGFRRQASAAAVAWLPDAVTSTVHAPSLSASEPPTIHAFGRPQPGPR